MEMEKFFLKVVEAISDMALELANSRAIEYPGDTFASASALIYCPRKWKLRRQYPDVEYTNIDIQEGFFWEERVKNALIHLFPDRVLVEPQVEVTVLGKKIVAHPDVVIRGKKLDLILELKSPKYLRVLGNAPIESGLIVASTPSVDIPEHYILQNRIQQFIWRKARRECTGALFIFTTTRKDGKFHRIHVARIVDSPLEEREMEKLVRRFEKEDGPRFSWECDYCQWKKLGYCEGLPFQREEKSGVLQDIPPEVEEAVREIHSLRNRIKDLEIFLKNIIPYGTCYRRNGKPVGWEKVSRRRWNIPSLVLKLLDKFSGDRNKFAEVISTSFSPKRNIYDLLYPLLEDEIDDCYSLEEDFKFRI